MRSRVKQRKQPRVYVTVTDPKTKKSVSTTVPGNRDEVIDKIERSFAPVSEPQPVTT